MRSGVVPGEARDPEPAGRRSTDRAPRPREGNVDRMALIELRDVTKSYKRDAIEIPVLDRVSITRRRRATSSGLMGPSGSGKSTLLNLLAGIDRPTRGSIRIGDTEISSLSERALAAWRARHIGFIFQLYNLIPVLTAFENVELPLLLTSLSKKQRREHVMTALGIVGLERSRRSTIRVSSRADRNSASRSRARSSPTRRCCSPTSRPATSTRSRPARC